MAAIATLLLFAEGSLSTSSFKAGGNAIHPHIKSLQITHACAGMCHFVDRHRFPPGGSSREQRH